MAAGKRLAEYHRRAKQALEQGKEQENNDVLDNGDSKWMAEIILTALTIIGISLTAIDLYFRWRKNDKGMIRKLNHIMSIIHMKSLNYHLLRR